MVLNTHAAKAAVKAASAEASALDTIDRMPLGPFYETKGSLPGEQLGALIRASVTKDYVVPRGVRVIRMLYHSRSSSGKDVPASALIFLPAGRPPSGGWPVIAWAHPTTGVARICAQSLDRRAFYRSEAVPRMVDGGFAVVATDYAGLGTVGPFQYLSLDAHANDVIGAVRAALSAGPELGSRWVADGNAVGGGAAWAVAQEEATFKDPGYLGAVAVAAPVSFVWTFQHMRGVKANSFRLVLLAYAIHARFPRFQLSDMLSKSALAQYDALTSQGCARPRRSVQQRRLLGKSTVAPGWLNNPWVKAFAEANTLLRPGIGRPVLLISGGADALVPSAMERSVARGACRLGYRLQYREYPKLSHETVMAGSITEQLGWIRRRFLSQPVHDDCGQLDRH